MYSGSSQNGRGPRGQLWPECWHFLDSTTSFPLASFQSRFVPPYSLREQRLLRGSSSIPLSYLQIFFPFYVCFLPRLVLLVKCYFYPHLHIQFFANTNLSFCLLHLIRRLLPLLPILLQAWSISSELHTESPEVDNPKVLRHSEVSVSYTDRHTWERCRL